MNVLTTIQTASEEARIKAAFVTTIPGRLRDGLPAAKFSVQSILPARLQENRPRQPMLSLNTNLRHLAHHFSFNCLFIGLYSL
jgi:hypothetical protein